MVKKFLSAFLFLTIIFVVMFAIYRTINISIVMALVLLAMALGRTRTKLSEKEILMILAFLSIIVIIIVSICSQKELFRTILMCIAIPALAFSAYYISKRFMRDKRKPKKNL